MVDLPAAMISRIVPLRGVIVVSVMGLGDVMIWCGQQDKLYVTAGTMPYIAPWLTTFEVNA